MLDIIIPHYTESWEVGKKFFAMLDLQRGIDYNQIHVILVNDGLENSLLDEYFENKKYSFEQISIPHAGVSAARNKGLEIATAEWVMFCDFDDLFSNVYALRNILSLLPAPDFDMLWADMYMEDSRDKNHISLYNRNTENVVFTHSKIYRRKFLIENKIWFDTNLTFNEDSQFNAELHTVLDYKRDGHIISDMPPYIWCWRSDSTTKQGNRHYEAMLCHYQRNKNVTELHRQRLSTDRHCGMVARTVWDAYYALHNEPIPEELAGMREDFKTWYKERKKFFFDTNIKTMKEVFRIAYAESIDDWKFTTNGIEEPNFMDEYNKLKMWLVKLEAEDISDE